MTQVALLYQRAKETDSQCLELMQYIPSARDLAANIGVAKETVVTSLQVAGFLGAPGMMDGSIGDGMLVITELNGRHRLHFIIHQKSASMQSKEHFSEKVRKSEYAEKRREQTSKKETVSDGFSASSSLYDLRARYAYRSQHSVEGGYMVDGTYVEFLAAHAEWQDTGKVSKLFTGSQYESNDSSYRPPTPPPKEPCCPKLNCLKCPKLDCLKCPKLDCFKCSCCETPVVEVTSEFKNKESDKGNTAGNFDEVKPELERYLTM